MLLFGVKECSRFVPLLGGDLPYLAGVPAGDEVSLFGGDDAHAGFFGDAAGGEIADCLWSAEDRKAEGQQNQRKVSEAVKSLNLTSEIAKQAGVSEQTARRHLNVLVDEGKVNVDDYGILDFNVGIQGGVL